MDYTHVYAHISEQPVTRSYRFRYVSDKHSIRLPGRYTTAAQRTHPSIRICNYVGPVVVVVSCVTEQAPHRPHPNQLVGPSAKYGVLTKSVDITEQSQIVEFDDLRICRMKKDEFVASMEMRKAKRVDPFKTGFKSKPNPKEYDFTAVRLCFQVFLTVAKTNNRSQCQVPIAPIVTEAIIDKLKNSELNISHISEASAPATGGKYCLLFCEKINREDIAVRFVERVGDKEIWSTLADRKSIYVHHHVAIAFRVPPFRNEWIEQQTKSVMMHLYRPSDGASGTMITFIYTPDIDFMTKQQSMKRFRRNETQSRELYQLISEHMNSQRFEESNKSPLRQILNDNAINTCNASKRTRQKEHRSRDILQQIIDESLIQIYGNENIAPTPDNRIYNIIEEDTYPAYPTPAQTPAYPTPAQTPSHPLPTLTPLLPMPALQTPRNSEFNPTNPFACDMIKNPFVNGNTEFKPSNIPQHGIFHDIENGNDYQILTPATTPQPAYDTNPFRQAPYDALPPEGSKHPANSNAIDVHLQSLQARNTLPVLELNSNDLQAGADKHQTSNDLLHNYANVNDMTLSFSSLNL